MQIGVPREIRPDERRVALVPESCKKLVKAGVQVAIQSGAGTASNFADADYQAVGATIVPDAAAALGGECVRVRTRREFASALARAHAKRGRFQLVEAMIPAGALSQTLQRFVAGVKRTTAPA